MMEEGKIQGKTKLLYLKVVIGTKQICNKLDTCLQTLGRVGMCRKLFYSTNTL